MIIFLVLLIIFCSICPMQLKSIFNTQDTLTTLCHPFPLMSINNDSSLQCTRLRIDESISSTDFNVNNPTQISLLIIIDQLVSSTNVNLIVNFNQSSNLSLSINEIRLGLLVIHSSFIINNYTTVIYSSNQIPILHWKKSEPNSYDLIDLLVLDDNEYKTDTSMCDWKLDRWSRLFNGNSSNTSPYAYILKTTNTNLLFTLADTKTNLSLSPYLQILYCIPYQFGTTELVLVIIFALLFIVFLVVLSILQYLKSVDSLSRFFHRKPTNKLNYSRTSISSIEYVD